VKTSCARRALIALVLVVAAAAGPAGAQGTDEAGQKQKLQQLRSEIDANRKEIEKLKSREKNLSKLQQRLARDRDLTRTYLEQLERQDTAIRSDLAGRQADLFVKEAALSETTDRLKRGLVRYYKMRQVAGPELIFSSRNFGELFARSQRLARVIYRERLELEALALEKFALSRDADALESRRRDVESLQAEKRREEERLRKQGAAALAELGDLRDERAGRERRVRGLEAAQAAIRRMLEQMERERLREREGARPSFKGSLASGRGRLEWPVLGKVVSEFGYETHPEYGTRVPQNGIDIAAEEGSAIRAVAPGATVYVDWLPGYGRTVILDHGSGYYTLYAHAQSVAVRKGESVAAGQIIARVGDTDSVKGSCLHFEVRQGERALNPREWLRR